MSILYDAFRRSDDFFFTFNMISPRRVPVEKPAKTTLPVLRKPDPMAQHYPRELPPHHHVVFVDDRRTDPRFVYDELRKHFHKTHADAMDLVYEVREEGGMVAGTYPLQIAEHKVNLVREDARRHRVPVRVELTRAPTPEKHWF